MALKDPAVANNPMVKAVGEGFRVGIPFDVPFYYRIPSGLWSPMNNYYDAVFAGDFAPAEAGQKTIDEMNALLAAQ